MKRFLSFFLAFLFLAGALPLFSAVYAEGKGTELPEVPIESPETKVFKRKKLPDKSFRITGYTGSDAEISIPPEILGFAVTEIGDGAFSGKEITRVSVPDGVKAIGAGAFENCARLETVVIADSVESIGTSAFKNCTSLTSFSVPARTSVISSGTFSGCTSLKEISLPAEFEKIEADAFLGSGSVSVVYFAGTREQWGKVFIDPEGNGAISAATLCCSDDDGHAFRTVTVAPTCTEDGYTALACTECSEVRVILTFSALGHEYTETVTEPTCTERGFTTHTCSRCGDSYDDTYVEASGHDFGADGNAEKCAVCGEKNPDYKSPVSFRDVPADAYYKAAVDWAVSSGVTLGTSETTFSPDKACTRGQAVTFLWRAAGQPEPSGKSNPFGDVKTGEYYFKAVLWAVENGITLGTSKTTFSPGESCTRAQIVTFIWRAAGSPSPEKTANPFRDVGNGDYFRSAVLWAVGEGITTGTSKTSFSPGAKCTRCQIVTFLYRAK